MSLQFFCPQSTRPIDSRIEIDQITLDIVKYRMVSVACSQCGRDHRFVLADGVRKDKYTAAS
jgi:RNase P subunit RPR2